MTLKERKIWAFSETKTTKKILNVINDAADGRYTLFRKTNPAATSAKSENSQPNPTI